MNLRWTLAAPPQARVEQVTAGLGISPLLARCLLARMPEAGEAIAPLQQFLAPRLRDLADPFLLPDMHAAVDRLRHARVHKERVVIFGDYDVDGITATAILLETLRGLGWEVEHYLPHRLEDGYGLTAETAGKCLAQYPARLLVAVDCGSSSAAAIDGLQRQGVDVIVLDHHQVDSPAPQPRAFVNPRRGGSFHELCSAGLAFKLAHALVKEGRARGEPDCLACDLRPLLELVALGTIADIVPLCGENRPMVRAGILHLQATKRPGLQALLRVAQCGRKPGGYEIAFQLAPRLNAAGRLEDAMLALALLLARDAQQADPLALRLDEQNRERQRLERVILEQVLARLHHRFHAESDYVIIEGDGLWHIGVVGIVAARVMREFYRPTIILGGNEATWRGSGRSIPGFDLASALRDCGELLERSGGHALAAGLTMDPRQIEPLRRRLNECARAALQGDQLRPELRIDAPVGLEELTTESVAELEALEPVGCGNPEIILLAQTLRLVGAPQRVGKNEQHWKFRVTDGRAEREAIWWGAKAAEPPAGEFALAFSPELNEYGGRTRVQLRVRDWKPAALTALSPGG